MVLQDIRENIISDWTAENVYRVVYDKTRLKVDVEATETARASEREARLRRGKPYDEFEKEWLSQQVDETLLKFYGRWPSAEAVHPVIRM
jgi:acetophenone carboxylase